MTQSSKANISRRQALSKIGGGLGGVSAFALLPACAAQPAASNLTISPPPPPYVDKQAIASANTLLEDIAYRLLGHQPERATGVGVDTGEHAGLRGKLEDQSQAGQDALAATLRKDLELVWYVKRQGLDAETITNLDVVESGYTLALDGMALPYGNAPIGSWQTNPYLVIQNCGTYINMQRFFGAGVPLNTSDDVGYYTERLAALPDVLNGELERVKAARAMGVIAPDFLLDKAIPQLKNTLLDTMKGGALLAPLETADIVGGDASVLAGAKEIITDQIAPALEAQLAELNELRKEAKGNPGMWAQPQGDEWYAWALRSSTTTTLTPDEIHQQGLEELASLHARMDPILQEIGYTKGSVGERMQGLSNDPRYKFADGDEGRKEIFEFIDDRIEWIKGQMPRAFNTLVDPNLEVRRIPINEQDGAPGAYGGAGSKDGSIPGRFWINLRTTDLHRKYDLADLTFHEAIPGHVWEGEYSNRLPLIRSILAFNPFSEGWALYGEQLADELGAYDEFKVGRLGYLQSLAFRACRMVVDTGLHSKRWSRDKAVGFFVERNGSKREEVESEVDRYCSWPGQATGYKLGHSRIVELREKASNQLDSAYDMKAFNDAIVLGGNAPMDVLAKNVDRYIAGAKG
ncbi:MAG: DUF885 domain-containing protein [Erythrobacter sp.]